ncbi:MAG: Gmad2 immunoglobulin-like domain-containing protein [Bacteroidota bacterium]
MLRLLLISLSFLLVACQSSVTKNEESVAVEDTLERQVLDYNPDNDARPLDAMIRVKEPAVNGRLMSPASVTGEAVGAWYFEGSFPVVLLGSEGEVLVESFATADGDWMQEGFVPFTAELEFSVAAPVEGYLELLLDNPAGDEGMDRSISIPVTIR